MCVLHTRLYDVLSQECISETCGISGCVGKGLQVHLYSLTGT